MERERIVILGAGFGGIAAARTIGKILHRSPNLQSRVDVVVVDQNNEHTYTPGLYETATTLRRDAEPLELKRASTISVSNILKPYPIRFIQDRAEEIDLKNRQLLLRDTGPLPFTKLLVAAGSRATDFGIPGVREHAKFLKTFNDALSLRRLLTEQMIDERDPSILIVGGGASGVEIAGEIIGFAKHLCSRDGRACNPAVSILEGSDSLIKSLTPGVGRRAQKRLEQLGVSLVFGARVTAVEEHAVRVTFSNDARVTLPYHLLIWTAGIEPVPVCSTDGVQTDKRGRWIVNEKLQVLGNRGIYAVGDITSFKDPETASTIPGTAYVAIGEAKIAGRNILAEITRKPLRAYTPSRRSPMVIPIGGRWAIAHIRPVIFSGFIAFIARLLIDLQYFVEVLPLRKALRFFVVSTKIHLSNDP